MDNSGWEIGQSLGPYVRRTTKHDTKANLGKSIRPLSLYSETILLTSLNVNMSARKNTVVIGTIFMKFDICGVFLKIC